MGRGIPLNIYLRVRRGEEEIYSNSIPILASENETLYDIITRLVNNANLPDDVKTAMRRAIEGSGEGESGYTVSVVDRSGTMRVIPPDERIGHVVNTYGTNQLVLEVENIVGIEYVCGSSRS